MVLRGSIKNCETGDAPQFLRQWCIPIHFACSVLARPFIYMSSGYPIFYLSTSQTSKITASIFGATLPAMVPKVTLGTKAADALYAGSMGAMMDLVATGLSGGSGGVTGLNGGSGGVVAPFTTFSQLLNLGK